MATGTAEKRPEKMDEDDLLSMLQRLEDDSSQYTFGDLQTARRESVKEYYQRPYGNEEAGWSGAITSDVQDTIEWMLPDLLDMFVSSEDAVVFDPTKPEEEEGAEQATDACNYVFYKQNNGFLVLYSAFKNALLEKTGITHWRKETKRIRETVKFEGVTRMEVAALMQEGDEVESAELVDPGQPTPLMTPAGPMIGADGMPMMMAGEERFNVRLARITERKVVRVDAVPPDHLLVHRAWTSPLLEECPYVCRFMEVSLSDVNELAQQMGFDPVTAEDLAGSDEPAQSSADSSRMDRTGLAQSDDRRLMQGVDNDDPTMTMGWLRIEWVLVDFDHDGIAERREIWRLDDRVLYNEECKQVPVSLGSPVIVPHQWDGMSIAEAVSDLQKIRTDLLRHALNNASLAANPRKQVLVDKQGAPYVDVDDLADYRPGGYVRTTRIDGLAIDQTPFVASQVFPIMEYVDGMREQRTGITKQRMGQNDANALQADRTLGETRIVDEASRQRIKLIARVLAETIVKPTFKGILKLLTEGDMENVAFRLRGKFVDYNPNDWRDSYDMTTNVGLGTGDRESKIGILTRLGADQLALAASPLGEMLVTPLQIYETRAKILDLSGFKNVDAFWTKPVDPASGKSKPLPTKPPAPPPDSLLVEKAKQEFEIQTMPMKQAAERQARLDDLEAKRRDREFQDAVQARNDERDDAREARMQSEETVRKKNADDARERLEAAKLNLDRYNADRDRANALLLEKMKNPAAALPQGWGIDPMTGELLEKDPLEPVMAGLSDIAARQDALAQHIASPASIVRDEFGNPAGVEKGGIVRPIVRDESGRVVGLQ